MTQKLIIDADPGVSDALAIAIAFADPELDVIALTAVGGRVTAAQAGRNLMTLLECFDLPKRPRLGIADSPETEYEVVRFNERMGEEAVSSRDMNGESGLGDWPVSETGLHHPKSAAKLMIELTRESPHEITLLTLGPLTTVALAMELDAEFLSRLKGLVCYGGTYDGVGDVTAAAEFNVCFNPTAARNVLRYPATKTLIPLGIGRKSMLTFERVQQLSLGEFDPRNRLVRSLLAFALRANHLNLGIEGLWLSDLATIASISRPNLFTRQRVAIDVETEGRLTRGTTVFDRRPRPLWRPNIDVLTDVDAQGLLDYATAMFARIDQLS